MEVINSACVRVQPTQRRTGRVVAILLAILLVAFGVTPLLAQSPSFPNFSSTTNLVLNGSTAVSGTALRLTPASTYQAGSAWYSVLQPVAEGFSTTFTFKLSNPSVPPADGIAFVIQNSQAGTQALGANGGYLGYTGIDNSLAIEFDTYLNQWDPDANHIAIQSCGTAPNTAVHTVIEGPSCELAIATAPVNLSDGNAHTVRIDYSASGMQVMIDTLTVFDGPVAVNLGTLLTLASISEGAPADSAYVGFTGATGADFENNDILSWTFTPHAGQTITQTNLPANQFTTFNFGSYLYKVRPNQNINQLAVTEVPVNPIPPVPVIGAAAADQTPTFDPGPNFPGANCITYDSTGSKCIEFHAVCTPPIPDDNSCSNVSYDVATSYDVIGDPTSIANNGPGFLKASGQSCPPPASNPFDANIITQFTTSRTDPTTKGSSKPSFSCFVAVQGVTYKPADLDILNIGALKVKPNTNLSYISTVANFGPNGAQGVAINNTIPSGTTYVNSALCTLNNGCSNSTCSLNGTVASCLVGNLDRFGLEFMVTTVKVTATSGTLYDTAVVTSFNPDPDNVPDRASTAKTVVSTR